MPRSKDLLDTGSVHSKSSHAKDEFCSVTVRKSDPKEKAGIRLEQEASGRVTVSNIASNGLFADSEIEIGDVVLSINAKRLKPGEGPEALVDVIKNATSTVTVVVKKANMKPRVEKKVKNPNEVQDNNLKQRDSYYEGLAQRNADGSLNLTAKPRSKASKKKAITTTISGTKVSPKDTTAGLTFTVKDQALYISSVDGNSIFKNTDLEVGDRVLSINDMNFRTYADATYAQTVVKKAKEGVTLIVEKSEDKSSKKGGKCLFNSKTKNAKKVSSDEDLSSTDTSTSDDGEDDMILPLKSVKSKEVVIAAPKSFSKQEPGLEFRVDEKTNKLIVYRILDKSIFLNTSLEEGDVILSINDECFRYGANQKRAILACLEAKESISLLVVKNKSSFKSQEFNLDSSVTNLNWQ